MAGLKGKAISTVYKSLLRVNDNSGIDASTTEVTDGGGTVSALKLSDDNVQIIPQNDDTTSTFSVRAKGGTPLLAGDSTNSVVKAGVGQFNVLTQYAYFGFNYSNNASLAANDKPDAPVVTEPITPLVSHNGVPILIVGTTLSADTSNTSASPTYLFMSGSVTV